MRHPAVLKHDDTVVFQRCLEAVKDRYDGLALQLLRYQGHYLLFRRDVDTKE